MPRRRTRRQSVSAPRARANPWPLAVLLAAVFAIKLAVLLQLQDHPLLQPDAGLDTSSYVQLARRVLAGDLALGPGLYFLSPLYIYVLAASLALSDSFTAVRVMQIALGTAAVGLVFLAARQWYGARAGWIAAGMAALTGSFTFYEVLILQTAIDPFLTSAGLWCLADALHPSAIFRLKPEATLKAPVRPDRAGSSFSRQFLVAGMIFGLQALNRPNILLAAAGIALVMLVVARMARPALLLTAGMLISLAPVMVRNAVVSRQFALASSHGGLNFYIGNHAGATGHYVAIPGVRPNIEGQAEDTRRVAEQAAGRKLTDAEVSRHFAGLAWEWIATHPWNAAKLFVRKLALVFNARHQWLDFSYPYYAYDTGSILWLLFVGPWLLVPLGLTGLIVCRPAEQRAEYFAWTTFVPFYAVSVALFFVGERYRLPLLVALCAPAGAMVDRMLAAFRRPAPSFPPAAPRAAVVLAVAAILAFWPFHLDDGRFDERLRLGNVLMNRRDFSGAARELSTAHAIRPADTVAEFTLGMALVSDGRAAEGMPHVRHAVESGVTIKGARYALASAMLASGGRDGAARLLRTYTPADDDDAMSCFQVGVLAMNAGAPDVAERFASQALLLRPGWREAEQLLSDSRR